MFLLKPKNKLIIGLSILAVMLFVFYSFVLYARKTATHSYKGSDGKWYWVEWHVDSKYGTEYSKVWIHGEGGPYVVVGHNTPEKPSNPWWWPFGILPDGDSGDNFPDPTWPGTASVPVTPDMLANTTLLNVSDNGIKVSTDKPIKAKIIDLVTGVEVCELTPVLTEHIFQLTSMPSGCRYSMLIYQNFDGVEGDILINTHNFCK